MKLHLLFFAGLVLDATGLKNKYQSKKSDLSTDAIKSTTCHGKDKCRLFAHCASFDPKYLGSKNRHCALPRGIKGLCCPGVPKSGSTKRPFTSYLERKAERLPQKITVADIKEAAKEGHGYKHTYKEIEKKLVRDGAVVAKDTPAYRHLKFFRMKPEELKISTDNMLMLKATEHIKTKYSLTNTQAGMGLQGHSLNATTIGAPCLPAPACNLAEKYRSLDGTCNNLQHSRFGQSKTPFIRLLPPDYADGIWSPRVRKGGKALPSARIVSITATADENKPDSQWTDLVMQIGQFVDHDMTMAAFFRYEDMSGIDCCKKEKSAPHPACFPISIPRFDPQFTTICMNFVRTLIAPRHSCDMGHAEQLNQLTHWVDASQIYGNDDEAAASLREMKGGLLKFSQDLSGKHHWLPVDSKSESPCNKPPPSTNPSDHHCFRAGDPRVNEQIALTSMHTLWLREHNRIAKTLADLNSDWDDETLYQETRRIVIAVWQHIIYNEWLPTIVGRSSMESYGILPQQKGLNKNGYDPTVDPTISNAFAGAAFRMGHSLVQGKIRLQNGGGGVVGNLTLRDYFFNPHLLRKAGYIGLISKGQTTQPMQSFDNYVSTELRDHLFETVPGVGGLDLVAVNVQRGRDHGLPGYNEYRKLCGVRKASTFSDLAPVIDPVKIPRLERAYKCVDDIDLYVGGIFEKPVNDSMVGPTFLCLIAEQFARLQKGDRFFYSNPNQPYPFTKAQLDVIRKSSMARILCDNADYLRTVQPMAFLLPDKMNPILSCDDPGIPKLDLSVFKK